MKTITLTEEAYQRIAVLKAHPEDSFSKVILRAVPARGTAARMLDALETLPPLSEKQARVMREVVAKHNNPKSRQEHWAKS